MRILLTGGGTAGHINPAIAIADTVKNRMPHAEIAFVGTPNGMEKRLVSEADYPMYPIRMQGFSRSLSPRNIQTAFLALTSPYAARKILEEFSPSLVIGTGGYVSWPLLRAAATAGIPTALHESNAVPGLTTKKLAPYMDALWLNFRETAAYLPPRCVSPTHTGNPLRRDFSQVSRAAARKELGLQKEDFFILSFGGSRGAERINEAALHFMKEELPKDPTVFHLHATGEKHYEACRSALGQTQSGRARLVPYISKMATYMAAADIVVCRAGAMTLSELALCGKCAVLIPSPHVAGDHQRKNALLFQKRHAACMIEESELPRNKFGEIVFSLRSGRSKRAEMEKNIQKMAIRDANEVIWGEIEQLAKKRRQI